MNKIIFLVGVLFLGNVNGMNNGFPVVGWYPEDRALDREKCMIVRDALSEANSELHNKFESSEKPRDKIFYHGELAYTAQCLWTVKCCMSYPVEELFGQIVSCLQYAGIEKRERAIQALKEMGYENCETMP
jgi:hypothetical protein